MDNQEWIDGIVGPNTVAWSEWREERRLESVATQKRLASIDEKLDKLFGKTTLAYADGDNWLSEPKAVKDTT